MMDDDRLTEYMSEATERLISNVRKTALGNPRMMAFLLRFALSSKKASNKRKEYQSKGIHIPGFLICSITTECNLRCKGCYAVGNGICGVANRPVMTAEEWDKVFDQADSLGISFMVLAGGEPLMRKDMMSLASKHKDAVFPVFTNGMLIPENIDLFVRNPNLIPVLSIDGPREANDERRGRGVYDKVMESMLLLNANSIFHGASVTVNSENIEEVTSDIFVDELCSKGTGIVFFIEHVPTKGTECLCLGEKGRERLYERMKELRSKHDDLVILSFPGDEKNFGGCIGAGRGFFHINPYGDVEACPASPYSDTNLKKSTLAQAIASPLFAKIRGSEAIALPHSGGCALAEHESDVIKIIESI